MSRNNSFQSPSQMGRGQGPYGNYSGSPSPRFNQPRHFTPHQAQGNDGFGYSGQSPNYHSPRQWSPGFQSQRHPQAYRGGHQQEGGRYGSPGLNTSYRAQAPPFSPSPRGRGRGNMSWRGRGDNNPGGSDDISVYYSPEMVADPWRHLVTDAQANATS